MSAPLIGVDGTPDGCAFEMREMKHNILPFRRSGRHRTQDLRPLSGLRIVAACVWARGE